MSVHFKVTDPRGRIVTCTDEIWNWHICNRPADMEGSEEAVKVAIQKPQHGLIYRDVDEANRDIFYHLPSGKKHYIKVIVKYDARLRGQVISAFRTSAPRSGELIIWPE
jgi:hypothetical protein